MLRTLLVKVSKTMKAKGVIKLKNGAANLKKGASRATKRMRKGGAGEGRRDEEGRRPLVGAEVVDGRRRDDAVEEDAEGRLDTQKMQRISDVSCSCFGLSSSPCSHVAVPLPSPPS